MRIFQRETALPNECLQSCAHIVLDSADIVRDGDFSSTKVTLARFLFADGVEFFISNARRTLSDIRLRFRKVHDQASGGNNPDCVSIVTSMSMVHDFMTDSPLPSPIGHEKRDVILQMPHQPKAGLHPLI